MTDRLVVLADSHIMGEVRRSRSGRSTFVYDDGWRAVQDSDEYYVFAIALQNLS